MRRKTTIAQTLPEEPVEGGNTEEGKDDDSVEEDEADLCYQDERVTLNQEEVDELFGQSEDEEECHGFYIIIMFKNMVNDKILDKTFSLIFQALD